MYDGQKKKGKHIFLVLRIAVIAGVVIWAASRIGQEQQWNSFVEHFRRIHLWVFASALGIFVLGQAIVGLRWWLLLRTQSIFINFWAAMRLNFLGLFYNNFMPGSVGGDLIRAWYVTKHTDKKFEAALSVFVDRVVGLLSTLVIAAFFYILFPRGRGAPIAPSKQGKTGLIESIASYKGVILCLIVALAVIFVGLLLPKRGREIMKKALASIRIHSLRLITKFKDAIIIYCSKPQAILMVFSLTVLMQLMVITGFWFLAVNMGIEASIKYYYVFFTLAWTLGAIPVSIGGAGVVEASLVWLFVQRAGMEEASAWAIALCQRAVWMIASLPGAVIHLTGTHLPGTPKDFSQP
jgi:uncharacterized protein (TIRG00374 family)